LRTRFIGFERFGDFTRVPPASSNQVVLLSPEIDARIPWDELVVSWNVDAARVHGLRMEAQIVDEGTDPKWYTLGLWAPDPRAHPRESVQGQKDALGEVQTDTLVLRQKARRVRLRLALVSTASDPAAGLRFVGLSFLNRGAAPPERQPRRKAWGRELDVPARSQLDYDGGEVWCSPTSTSMLLAYWAGRLGRPELDRPVPEVARAVFDPNWPGTGNWPFNMAYAGAFPGLRAYVTRLDDLRAVEDRVASGVPVALSVSYNRLKGKPHGGSGHLVVCVGFTSEGEVIVHDPGVRENVRRVFARSTVELAWAESHNTVYIVHPVGWEIP
jgi:hypothetical protein